MSYSLSAQGLKLIGLDERCVLHPYLDVANVPTIAWGNTFYEDGRRVTMADPPITQVRANQLRDNIMQIFVEGVNSRVRVPLTQAQFDALVSFAYNEGLNHLSTSTLLRDLNAGLYTQAAEEFLRWDIADGKHNAGLHDRRERERALFLSA